MILRLYSITKYGCMIICVTVPHWISLYIIFKIKLLGQRTGTALLRYNLYTTSCTFLKCTIWCFDACIYLWIHQHKVMNLSITHKSFLIIPIFLRPCSPRPKKPLIWFLSSWISLRFLEFYTNGIIQFVLLFGLTSLTSHNYSEIDLRYMLFHVLTSFLFWSSISLHKYPRLPIHLLMDIQVVSSCGLSQVKLLWTFVYKY